MPGFVIWEGAKPAADRHSTMPSGLAFRKPGRHFSDPRPRLVANKSTWEKVVQAATNGRKRRSVTEALPLRLRKISRWPA